MVNHRVRCLFVQPRKESLRKNEQHQKGHKSLASSNGNNAKKEEAKEKEVTHSVA